MCKFGGHELLEPGDELVGALWGEIELEQFDRDEAFSRRIVSAIDRP
jgi:hypothetical protein